jgi:hypothetical protein
MTRTHTVRSENAAKVWDWLQNRGGLAVWSSVNLSNPGASWTSPALDKDGTPTAPPNWQVGKTPRVITDPSEVVVSFDKEVKRFHIATRIGAQGFFVKVTDGGTRRIRAAVAKAGEGAYHTFDYDTQQAVIWAPERTVPLVDWAKESTK